MAIFSRGYSPNSSTLYLVLYGSLLLNHAPPGRQLLGYTLNRLVLPSEHRPQDTQLPYESLMRELQSNTNRPLPTSFHIPVGKLGH